MNDFRNLVNDQMEQITANVDDTKSEINLLRNMITSLVTDENGNSLMTQTSSGWTFNMGSINAILDQMKETVDNSATTTEDIQKIADDIKDELDTMHKTMSYVNIVDINGQPCIELGALDSPFKVRITNTDIRFIQGGESIAYISNKQLYITNGAITNQFQIGDAGKKHYIWSVRSNGNLGLTYYDD